MIDTRLHREIDKLIASRPGWQDDIGKANLWLRGRYTEAYFRLGSYHHLYNDQLEFRARTLDLANIAVKEKFRGHGVLTNLMLFLEAKRVPLFIENVLEPRLCNYFEKRGYHRQEIPGYDYPRSYFLAPLAE